MTQMPIDRLRAIYDATVDRLAYLQSRWLDEREYEDFTDYEAAIRAAMPADVRVTQVLRRPFGVRFTLGDGDLYQMSVTTRKATLKRIARGGA